MKYDCAKLKAFSGFYIDHDLLKKSASGGAAAALTDRVLSVGGVVFGVVYADDFKSAHYAYATTPEKAERFKGSKYILAKPFVYENKQKQSVYQAVARELQAGKTVLFTGIGCYVGGLKQYLRQHGVDDARLVTVDLFCHGTPHPQVQIQTVEKLEAKFHSKIKDFSVRYKKNGWVPRYMHAVFENGKVWDQPLDETDFGYAFKTYSRDACFSCNYKGDFHVADITVGDYWGIQKDEEGYNPYGVSVIISRTEKGLNLIQSLDPQVFALMEIAPQAAANGNRMFYECREKPADAAAFKNNLNKRGLSYAVRHSAGYRKFCVTKAKGKIKRIIPKTLLERIR